MSSKLPLEVHLEDGLDPEMRSIGCTGLCPSNAWREPARTGFGKHQPLPKAISKRSHTKRVVASGNEVAKTKINNSCACGTAKCDERVRGLMVNVDRRGS